VVLRETTPMNMLIVDDEPTIREACGEVAQLTGMNATMVAIAEKAIEILENAAVDIVLTDLMLPHTTGLELLKRVHETHPNLPVIVLTRYGTIDAPVAATRMGAIDYVTKPFRIEELRARLERASGAVELQQENQLLREPLCTRPGFGGLIGLSERMQRVYKTIQKVGRHEYPAGAPRTGRTTGIGGIRAGGLCAGGGYWTSNSSGRSRATGYGGRGGLCRSRGRILAGGVGLGGAAIAAGAGSLENRAATRSSR
jgi:FixJ family two-component response regulator